MAERQLTDEEREMLKTQYSEKSQYSELNLPSYPGPAALGHTPLLGSARRGMGIPVARDRAVQELDELDGVDLPDKPVLPILNLR